MGAYWVLALMLNRRRSGVCDGVDPESSNANTTATATSGREDGGTKPAAAADGEVGGAEEDLTEVFADQTDFKQRGFRYVT